jgi:tryptophan synthase beta chain
MESYGAKVFPGPTEHTGFGKSILRDDPDSLGSLGIAISEAVEVAAKSGGTKKYSLGSVLNHVLMHQTVIGQEALKQMDLAGEYPDVVIGCVSGGSNFAGIAYPFLQQILVNVKKTRLLAGTEGYSFTNSTSYQAYTSGELVDYEYPVEAIKPSLDHLPKVSIPA